MGAGALDNGASKRCWEALKAAGYNQTSAARALGVRQSAVSFWARGKPIMPSSVDRVADLLGLDAEVLAYGADQVARRKETAADRLAAKIVAALTDRRLGILDRYTPETIELVMVASLERFADGVTVTQRRVGP